MSNDPKKTPASPERELTPEELEQVSGGSGAGDNNSGGPNIPRDPRGPMQGWEENNSGGRGPVDPRGPRT